MTSETDAEFLNRLEATPRYNPAYRTLDSDRLFALARRGADAAARIAQLEAALRANQSWLERWASHVGGCEAGYKCTCGLSAVRFETSTALEERT